MVKFLNMFITHFHSILFTYYTLIALTEVEKKPAMRNRQLPPVPSPVPPPVSRPDLAKKPVPAVPEKVKPRDIGGKKIMIAGICTMDLKTRHQALRKIGPSDIDKAESPAEDTNRQKGMNTIRSMFGGAPVATVKSRPVLPMSGRGSTGSNGHGSTGSMPSSDSESSGSGTIGGTGRRDPPALPQRHSDGKY